MDGYAAEEYARSLAEFGEPVPLPRSGGWLLARELPCGGGRDATGCYPLFSCRDLHFLSIDLRNLPNDIVAVSLVADPAANPTLEQLRETFPDVCYHYKDHYFADLSRPLASFVASHHLRNARKAFQFLRVEKVQNPTRQLPVWTTLYAELVRRHQILGVASFSTSSFAALMLVPGLRAYAAYRGDEIVGMVLWLVTETTAYYHLAAYSDAGYELKASFALFWHSLEEFAAEGIRWAGLGGGAGTFAASAGLSRFKEGWSTATRPAYFCGRILDEVRYSDLVARFGQRDSKYFPAYRAPSQARAA